MEDFLIPANPDLKTPNISFKVSGDLIIEGESISSNPVLFYEPALNWLQELKKQKPDNVILTMKLDYFNTSSSKIFYGMFKLLESFQKEEIPVRVIWCYEQSDDDMIQSGKDYSSIIKIPFEFEEVR
jgi:hypothetical protein